MRCFRNTCFCVCVSMLRLTQSANEEDATQPNGRHFVDSNTKAYTQSPRTRSAAECVCARCCTCQVDVCVLCMCARARPFVYAETCFEHVNSCRTTFHLIYVSSRVCVCNVYCVCELALLRCVCVCVCSARRRSTLNI